MSSTLVYRSFFRIKPHTFKNANTSRKISNQISPPMNKNGHCDTVYPYNLRGCSQKYLVTQSTQDHLFSLHCISSCPPCCFDT